MVFNPQLQGSVRFEQPVAPAPNIFDAVGTIVQGFQSGRGPERQPTEGERYQNDLRLFQEMNGINRSWMDFTPQEIRRFGSEFPQWSSRLVEDLEQVGAEGFIAQRTARDERLEFISSPRGQVASVLASAQHPDDEEAQSRVIETARLQEYQTQIQLEDLTRRRQATSDTQQIDADIWNTAQPTFRTEAFAAANAIANAYGPLSAGATMRLAEIAPDLVPLLGDVQITRDNLATVGQQVREALIQSHRNELRMSVPGLRDPDAEYWNNAMAPFDLALEALQGDTDPTRALSRFTNGEQLRVMREIESRGGSTALTMMNLFPDSPIFQDFVLRNSELFSGPLQTIMGGILRGNPITPEVIADMSRTDATTARDAALTTFRAIASGSGWEPPTEAEARAIAGHIQSLPVLLNRTGGRMGEDIYRDLFSQNLTALIQDGTLGPNAQASLSQVTMHDLQLEIDSIRSMADTEGHGIIFRDGQLILEFPPNFPLPTTSNTAVRRIEENLERINAKLRILNSPTAQSILGEGFTASLFAEDAAFQSRAPQETLPAYVGPMQGMGLAGSFEGGPTAAMRADETPATRQQVVQNTISSLSTTESGGNIGARNNVPGAGGNGHFGELQFSRARLDEARAAGVMPQDMTPEQFLQDANTQRAVNEWHINDIIDRIDSTGLRQYIGQTIAGVPVTVEGMIAVAHLGGFGGLQRFLSSGGQYNPQDVYGTSLLDYLQRHGQGGTTTIAEGVPILPENVEAIRRIISSGGRTAGEGSVVLPVDLGINRGSNPQQALIEQAAAGALTVTPEQPQGSGGGEGNQRARNVPIDPVIQTLIETLTSQGVTRQRLEEALLRLNNARQD